MSTEQRKNNCKKKMQLRICPKFEYFCAKLEETPFYQHLKAY